MIDLVNQSVVFHHAAKPEWGGAVIAWERDGKRGYQFEDGRLRVFTVLHYHLLERIDVSLDRVRMLRALLKLPEHVETSGAVATTGDRPTLDEQIAYFVDAFPDSFGGQRWRDQHRAGAERARKRHRDAAIALARKELTQSSIASALERDRETEGVRTFAAVLGETDLVPGAHLHRLVALPPNRARVVLVGLFDLLFAGTGIEVRMRQWLQALTRGVDRAPTWSLATAPLALVAPDDHVCVHRASFAAQASAMGLRTRIAATPKGPEYIQLLGMARRVRERLTEMSSPPADLLDVYDFIVLTLHGRACGEILARRGVGAPAADAHSA